MARLDGGYAASSATAKNKRETPINDMPSTVIESKEQTAQQVRCSSSEKHSDEQSSNHRPCAFAQDEFPGCRVSGRRQPCGFRFRACEG